MSRMIRLFLVFSMLAAGCASRDASPAAISVAPGPVDITISEVEVLRVVGETPDVRVVVSGTLPDDCSHLQPASIDRMGRLFNIDLPARRIAAPGCAAEPISFQHIFTLSLDQASGPVDGQFGVLVNGVLKNFTIEAAEKPQVAVTGTNSPAANGVSAGSPPAAVVPSGAALPEPPAASAGSDAQPLVSPPAVPQTQVVKMVLGSSTGPANCVNKAAFFEDVTVPNGTAFDPGATFTKTWKVRNEGTCTWGTGYELLLVNGNPMGAAERMALPPAAPKEIVQISVAMTAPSDPGTYFSDWGISTPEGQVFGVGSAGLYPLTMKIGVRQPPVAGLGCEVTYSQEYEQVILEQINAERAMRNLPPHVMDEALSAVARAHSAERGCIGVHSHLGADGKNYESRVKQAGISYKWINEIIYWGNYGPKPAVQWWVYQSQLHHDIVMAKKYTTVGVGYAKTNRGENKEYFTVLFSAP